MGVRQSYNLYVYLQGSGNNSEGRPSSLIEVDFGIPILDTYIYVAKQLEITCVCVCGERERERCFSGLTLAGLPWVSHIFWREVPTL